MLCSMLRSAGPCALVILVAVPCAEAQVTISSSPTKYITCSGGVCTPTHSKAVLNVSDLESLLASSNVTVNTDGAKASDIDVTVPVSWASTFGLTLDAYRSIAISGPVSDSGSGALALLTNDGGAGGALSIYRKGDIRFLGTSNALTINGNAYVLVDSISDLATNIASNPEGFYALADNYDAKADGTYSAPPIAPFNGAFDGLGNSIRNLNVRSGAGITKASLFGEVERKGSISHVNLIRVRAVAGGNGSAGALVARNKGLLFQDSEDGTVEGRWVGGLAGQNNGGTIEESSSSGAVIGRGHYGIAGGLVGVLQSGTIELSWSSAAVSSADYIAGGIVGENGGVIANDYATGPVSGVNAGSEAGGLAGNVDFGTDATSYATGAVTGAQSIGGYVGYVSDDGGFTNCYWDTTTSGTNQGSGNGNDVGVLGLTTAQLQAGLPAGFDPTVWAEKPSINDGLPYLIANPPPN